MHKITPIFAILLILSLLAGFVGTAKADSTVVITPTNMGLWAFHQFAPTGSGEIVNGPGTPPLWFGSARISSSLNGGMSLENTNYSGMRLDALTSLEYGSYRGSSDPNNNRTMAVQFEMDYDIDDPTKGVMGWLVFEPYLTAGQGTVMEDTWYTWNALAGEWYATEAIGVDLCTQSNPCTITELLAIYPDAGIRHNGAVRFASGPSWNLAFTGYVDALKVGINGVNTTFDFETVVPNYPPVADAGGPYTGDEGSNVSITGSASDPGSDPLTYIWTYTPGPDVDPGATCSFGDATALSTTFSCTDDGQFSLSLSASDGVNPAANDSATVTLGNLNPTVAINSPADGASFLQGQQVNLSAQVLEPGANDTLTCQVDWGDGSTGDGTLAGDSCTASHQYIQPGVFILSATVTDDDGGTHFDTIGITVLNVSPTVDITTPLDDASFSTGSQVDFSAIVFDPGGDEQLTCIVDWGDGESSAGLISAGLCIATHVYAQPAGHLITVNVTDEDGGSATDSVAITVVNLAPSVEAGGPYSGGEGQAISLSGFASDSESDPLTYAWTYTPSAGVDAGTSCSFADAAAAVTSLTCTDNGSVTLTLTVDDGINPPTSDSAELSLTNQAPVVNVTAPADGSTYTVGELVNAAASFVDDGSNDTHTCKVTWGDGITTSGTVAGSACSATHIYTAAGSYSLTVLVEDDDLLSGSDSVAVLIDAAPNSPPSLEAGGPYAGSEGQAINLVGTADDADGDTLTYSWTYSAGAGVDLGTACEFGNPAAAATTFTCSDNGQFDLTLTVNDGHNPPVIDTASVAVENQAPDVTITDPAGDLTFLVGEEVLLNATFTNPGGNDSHTCQVNWGDGAFTQGLVSGTTCTASHFFSILGDFTITVTITDDNGGADTASVDLTISDDQPAGPVFLPLMNKDWNSRQ